MNASARCTNPYRTQVALTPSWRQCALAAFLVANASAACRYDAAIELRNGRWLTGSAFEDRVVYVVDGRFSSAPPATVVRVVDLEGGFVIPPFGEAHNHRPDGWPGTTQGHVAQFIEQGVFYVMNPNSFPSMTRRIDSVVNRPQSIDVAFANGGFSPPGSHVTELYRRNLERGVFPEGWTRRRLDGEGYVIVRTLEDLDARWPSALAGRPDVIKVFMGFSEEYEVRRQDSAFVGKRGVNPALVPAIVERAHAAGLRVAAHIETAEDFRIAVQAGVDIVAHLPGSWRIGEAAGYVDSSIDRWLLTNRDGARAAEQGVAVVAHVHNGTTNAAIARIHAHNLALLKQHGVRLAIGSDSYRQTSILDAIYLQETGLFTPAEVLAIACEDTPQVVFPGRQIGRLADGYEASFLVIDGDPIRRPLFAAPKGDLAAGIRSVVARIRLRVKQGHFFDDAVTIDTTNPASQP